jgi:DNA-damage-inducible protein D
MEREMKQALIASLHRSFEEAVHVDGDVEYWLARELQVLLGYAKWQRFEGVVADAKAACERAGGCVADHFTGAGKMIGLGKGATRRVDDIALTRYACYLVAQNGDPRKAEIAFAMNYFAVQTRKQELVEKRIAEFERVQARGKLSLSQKAPTSTSATTPTCAKSSPTAISGPRRCRPGKTSAKSRAA